ncbi:MAG: MBL fold metallo-hydrolase [Anaerolineaceae bacterium]|nr:MBL fold metallo-hydrolase [Anaerolineaceae bacterium]
MKIHAIQTGTGYVKESFLRGSIKAGGIVPFLVDLHRESPYVKIPIYAWVIEHNEGIIVVDTGDIPSTSTTFLTQFKRDIKPDELIEPQLAKLGIKINDVAKVILTHIHSDHANGVAPFLNTPIWISQREYDSFHSLPTRIINSIALEAPVGFKPQPFQFQPSPLGTFESSFPLTKAGDVIAVPTPGHTPGHLSVIAIENGISTFIAGDVTYDEAALINQDFQGPSEAPNEQAVTLAKVLEYSQANPTIYLPSHDPESGKRLANKQIVPMQESKITQPA